MAHVLVALLLLTLLGLAAACREDDAAVTTPLEGAESGTIERRTTRTPTETPTPTGTPTPNPDQLEQADALIDELVAEFCGQECAPGIGRLTPAELGKKVEDLVVPDEPAGLSVVAGFLAPGSGSTGEEETASIEETTAVLIYVAGDASSWVELFEGPDTRTSETEGALVDLTEDVRATLVQDEEDEDAGRLEWATEEGTLFQVVWTGLAQDGALEFARAVAG